MSNLSQDRYELNKKIANSEHLTDDDLSKAREIAIKLGSIDDRVRYSKIKSVVASYEQSAD